jgi:phage terminase large subunit
MSQKIIEIEVAPKIAGIFSPARFKVYYGGRGSSKSHGVARYLLVKALRGKHLILCAREFQNAIQESVHRLLSTLIYDLGLSPFFTVNQTSIKSITGSEFIFKGLQQNIEGVKSMENISTVWVEEAATVSEKSWDILIPTIRAQDSEIIITFNPNDEKDPTYKRFITDCPPNTIRECVNWEDNPWFPDVLREEMEQCKKIDFDKYLHVWMGQPRSQGKASIYHGKLRSTYFSSTDVEVFRYGLDFGFGTDPCSGIRMFVRDRILHIDHEAYGYGLELHQLHSLLCNSLPGVRRAQLWCDASRPETIKYLCEAAAHNDFSPLNAVAAPKWSGSIEDGIEFIRSFDAIDIHPRCPHTLFDFRAYSYKIDRLTDEILPVIVDKHSHSPDAARYGLAPIITRRSSILDAI